MVVLWHMLQCSDEYTVQLILGNRENSVATSSIHFTICTICAILCIVQTALWIIKTNSEKSYPPKNWVKSHQKPSSAQGSTFCGASSEPGFIQIDFFFKVCSDFSSFATNAVLRQKVAYFNVSDKKLILTYFDQGEEKDRGYRKRKEKKEIGQRTEDRGQRRARYLFPLKFSISLEPVPRFPQDVLPRLGHSKVVFRPPLCIKMRFFSNTPFSRCFC